MTRLSYYFTKAANFLECKRLHMMAAALPLVLAVLAIPLAGLGIWSSHVERLTHFRMYWLVILAVLVVYHGLRMERWRAVLAVALIIWGAILPIRYAMAKDEPSNAGTGAVKQNIRCLVVTANLRASNRDRTSFRDWLGTSSADVVFLSSLHTRNKPC